MPNLKPKSLHTHFDKAERMGVPRSNVVDLRKQAALLPSTQTKPIDNAVSQSSPIVEQVATPQPKRIGWLARRRLARQARRRLQKEVPIAEPLANQSVVIPAKPPKPAQLPNVELPLESPTVIEAEDMFAVFESEGLPSEVASKKKRGTKKGHSDQRVKHPFGDWLLQLRPVISFVLICAVLVAPLATAAFFTHVSSARDEVVNSSREALSKLKLGGSSASNLEFAQASTAFMQAASDFDSANQQLQSVNGGLAPVIKGLPEIGNTYSSAENVLIAGEYLSEAASDVTDAFTLFKNMQGRIDVGLDTAINADAAENPTETTSEATDTTSQVGVTDMLVLAHAALRPAAPRIERAALALEEVDPAAFPVEYQEALIQAKEVAPLVATSVRELLSLNETLITLLGHTGTKRYLLLFQNNREIRPTGGFLGSMAIIEIEKGTVRSIEIPGGGTYDLQGGLRDVIESPGPLHYVNPQWYIQDANWWPDFPTSAQKIQWFYKKSGGGAVDGVITLTPEVIEEMLRLTGPIDMPEYAGTLDKTEDKIDTINGYVLDENYTITADNFYWVTQAQAERKYDDTNQSKKFIADLAPKLLNNLLGEADNFVPVLQTFQSALANKDILMYFNDPYIQDEMKQRGWTGQMQSTQGDYLHVSHTNIAGGKTDQVMNWAYQHTAKIADTGKITDTLTLQATHEGSTVNEFENIRNMQYVRVYVPKGSELVGYANDSQQPDTNLLLEPDPKAQLDEDLVGISGKVSKHAIYDVDVSSEFDKTVFGFWVTTEPGGSSAVSLTYTLPFAMKWSAVFKPADRYSLYVQKQPGLKPVAFASNVEYPSTVQVEWSYPEQGKTEVRRTLTQDLFTGVVLEQ